jgi:hypothetical protein
MVGRDAGVAGDVRPSAGLGRRRPRLTAGVAREWRRWSLTRGYLFGDATLDSADYAAYRGPLLARSMSDDRGFSPPGGARTAAPLRQRANRACRVARGAGRERPHRALRLLQAEQRGAVGHATRWLAARGWAREGARSAAMPSAAEATASAHLASPPRGSSVSPQSPSGLACQGRLRTRSPVAANQALSTAGAAPGTPFSPTPAGQAVESTMSTSTTGIADRRSGA